MNRKLSIFITAILLLNTILPVFLHAGEAPTQPEAAQFEPVDTSDMVSLANGNFNYNIPLLEVPGPEGNWPINMSYHAGIGPNTEATWVGLGWTLNPGSINRFMNGYPDDYFAGRTYSEVDAKKQKGKGLSLGISYGPVGMSMSFDSQTGFGGVNASLSVSGLLQLAGVPTSIGPVGVNASIGTQGMSLGLGMSAAGDSGIGVSVGGSVHLGFDGKTSASAGANLFAESSNPKADNFSLAGVSFGSGGNGASFSVAGHGAQSQTNLSTKGNTKFSSRNFSIPIPFVPGLSLNFGSYEWEWWLHEEEYAAPFGLLHQYSLYNLSNSGIQWYNGVHRMWNVDDNVVGDIKEDYPAFSYGSTEGNGQCIFDEIRMERSVVCNTLLDKELFDLWNNIIDTPLYRYNTMLPSTDQYQISVQGINGNFKPYFKHPYKVYDIDDDDTGYYEFLGPEGFIEASMTEGSGEIYFRFDGDKGGNAIAGEDGNADPWAEQIGDDYYGSKKIYPAIDLCTGQLLGFRIIADDGKIYEFFQPTFSFSSKTVVYRNRGEGDQVYDESLMITPYATSWMLTAIKGPDYLDRGVDGLSEDDWGFWVKFNYEKDKILPWRTPYWDGTSDVTYTVDSKNKENESASEGYSQRVYLKSIETATHYAEFSTNIDGLRTDKKVSSTVDGFSTTLKWKLVDTTGDGVYDAYKVTYPFEPSENTHFRDHRDTTDKAKLTFAFTRLNYWDSSGTYVNRDPDINNDVYERKINYEYEYEESQLVNDSPDDGICTQIIPLSVFGIGTPHNVHLRALTFQLFKPTSEPMFDEDITYSARKLDKIRLYNKNYINTSLKGIDFSYDYSLQQGAPNADTGKLTLRSIKKTGLNGSLNTLPSTKFYYGFNPDWSEFTWDMWGGYTSIGEKEIHTNAQIKEIADRDASAWLLNKIVSPTGAVTEIEYESDLIKKLGSGDNIANFTFSTFTHDYENRYNYHPTTLPQWGIVPTSDFYSLSENLDSLATIYNDYSQNYNDDAPFCLFRPVIEGWGTTEVNFNYSFIPVTIDFSNTASEYVILDTEIRYYAYSGIGFTLGYGIAPEFMYGGGHRIRSITLYNAGEISKTNYNYGNGVLSCFPEVIKHELHEDMKYFDYRLSLTGDGHYAYSKPYIDNNIQGIGLNLLGPSPGVFYDNVEVSETSISNGVETLSLNGKTVYEFYTPEDLPYVDDVSHQRAGDDANVWINNRTGVYGRMRSIKTYAEKPDGTFQPITTTEYEYSTNGLIGAKSYIRGELNPHTYELGMTSQRFYTKESSSSPDVRVHIWENNVFENSITTTVNHLDADYNVSGTTVTVQKNEAYDALSGKVIITSRENSKGNKLYKEIIPAYWHYPEMENKNMLTQEACKKEYSIPPTETMDFFDIRAYESNNWINEYLTYAEVTTWKDWTPEYLNTSPKGIYRKNDVYKYVGGKFDYEEFDFQNNPEEDLVQNGKWERMSNIEAFDNFGHAIDVVDSREVHSSTIYDVTSMNVIATVDNAEYLEAFACGFEQDDLINFQNLHPNNITSEPDEVKVGQRGIKLTELWDGLDYDKEIRSTMGFNISNPHVFKPNKTYVASIWFKAEPGCNGQFMYGENRYYGLIESHPCYGSGEWELHEIEFEISQENGPMQFWLRFQSNTNNDPDGYVLFDEIRIHPKDAAMTTYTYDDLTGKLIAITDENRLSISFEYDEMGRLIRTRDDEGNIISESEYEYSRGKGN